MMTQREVHQARVRALDMLAHVNSVLTPDEQERLEIADFGLGELE